MEKLKALDFTNANNAGISLHTLAEMIRVGDIKLVECNQHRFTNRTDIGLTLTFSEEKR